MSVLFEFLCDEAIENVISCMNYKFDRVIFFGYQETIDSRGRQTELFLKNHCGVNEVVFRPLSQHDFESVLKVMREQIEREQSDHSEVYCDITGGESLILVALGQLSAEYKLPLHFYDIPRGELIELDKMADVCISTLGEKQSVSMTLERLIEMHGGKINDTLGKDNKSLEDPEFSKDAASIWEVSRKNSILWNPFSDFLKKLFDDSETLEISRTVSEIRDRLLMASGKLKKPKDLFQILDSLEEKGILSEVCHKDGKFSMRFKNEATKKTVLEGGCALELHVLHGERAVDRECRAGVHIDWDGEIKGGRGQDVLNEVDVLTLEGNIPTFISCKSGKMEDKKILQALYELDTIAKRFGGKYAKKVLAILIEPSQVYKERADEMGIEIRVE